MEIPRRDEDNLLYISGANLNLMSRFYRVELGLKSTFVES